MAAAGYVSTFGVPMIVQVTAAGAAGGVGAGVTTRVLTGQDTTPEAVMADAAYGAISAGTFYGTSRVYEIVTTPKFPNTYIQDRLAAAEEMSRSEGCDGSAGTVAKPYSNSRPSFRNAVVGEVWENAKGPDGIVRDPNTGEIIDWNIGEPRGGVWDMGHIPEAKYSYMHEAYMNGELTTKEFVDWYNDVNNYRPELPSSNRSHRYE